jgi:predicted DNA-binding transcriptional regulator YafY
MKSYAGKEELLDILLDALEQLHECRIAYRSLSHATTKTYIVHPLKLLEHKGGLYLFVRIPKHDVIRLITVDRVQSAKLLGSTFSYPTDFAPDALLESAFDLTFDDPITAIIRFSPKDAPYVQERRYSADQSIASNPDGSITLTLTTSGSADLLRWLLSFGSGAEVLSPPALRSLARAELETALSHYEATV